MATMSTYSQFTYPYSAASQLLMTGSPNNVPPSSNSSASSLAASASGATSPSSAAGEPSANNNQVVQPASSSGDNQLTSNQTASPCCDTGRPIVTDPVTGQTVCSCQYDRLSASLQTGLGYGPALAAARLAAVSSAVTGVTGLHGVYSAAYPSSDQNPYPSLGMDTSTFYSSLTNPYSLKDAGSGAGGDVTWSTAPGLHQSAPGYYPYDPALAAYGYGASYDLAARRKNATRESTATLKAWLSEHKKNPYPTKGEKIMLAIITKMTLTQVSTWFANARRRLKKENKMTWEPKNRNDDDDDDDDCSGHSDDESKNSGQPNSKKKKIDKDGEGDEKSDCDDDSRGSVSPHLNNPLNHLPPHPASHHHHLMHPHHPHHQPNGDGVSVSVSVSNLMNNPYHHHHHHHHHSSAMGYPTAYHHPAGGMMADMMHPQLQPSTSPSSSLSSSSSNKPKIWSLADTAACKTPPPPPPQVAHSSGGMTIHHPLMPSSAAAAANHHAWFNGPMATGANSKMAVYAAAAAAGRYPLSYAGQGYTGSGEQQGVMMPQTDTPPQTPPNLKMAGLGQHQQQQYHPYASPHQHRMQQHQSQQSLPPPPPPPSEGNGEMLMLSPGASRQHMANPVNDASPSSSSSSTAFRPIYRTSPNSAGYPSSS